MLSRHADPNLPDEAGRTAMSHAAVRGFEDIVRRLLDAGSASTGATGTT
jgi:ankyrin repeat protein